MRHAGFTLLETLLAISLTASVGIAALSLTVMQARLGATARAQEEVLALVTETVRLLDDDLLLAVKHPATGHRRFQILEQGALRVVTSCHLPGEPPGLQEVVWRFDAATGTALRIATPLEGGGAVTRRVGRAWTMFSLSRDHDLLWLDGRIGTSDIPWRLPLWSETP